MKHVYEKDLHEQGQAIIPASHFGLSMAAQFSSCHWDSQPTQYDYLPPSKEGKLLYPLSGGFYE